MLPPKIGGVTPVSAEAAASLLDASPTSDRHVWHRVVGPQAGNKARYIRSCSGVGTPTASP